jgi:co-chaperonin GroES (HSP10)
MLPKSKFLPFFQENRPQHNATSKLVGDCLIVEKISFPEKRIGGIIIADASKTQLNSIVGDQPLFYRVLMVGSGYYDDTTKESVPLEVEPGAVILTGSISVRMFSHFPMLETTEYGVLGLTRFSDVNMYWQDEADFFSFLSGMNTSVKTAIEAEKSAK